MKRSISILSTLTGLVLLLVACGDTTSPSGGEKEQADDEKITRESRRGAGSETTGATFKVDNMVHRNGKLWMAWPNNIVKALDGLNGIEKAEFDLSKKRFRIRYDPEEVSRKSIEEKITSVSIGDDPYRVHNWKKREQ